MMTERADFGSARIYLERAVARLKMRNDNPMDTQPLYDLARLERLCGNTDRAYKLWCDASWQYPLRSASLYEIARIDSLRGDRDRAIQDLETCLETNAKHIGALTLLGYLKRDGNIIARALEISPLDTFARYSLWLLDGEDVGEYIRSRPEDVLDAALDFEKAGFSAEAVRVLESASKPSQLINCHLSRLTGKKPRETDLKFCHPRRLEDIAALGGDDWRSKYLLGCLYYDRMNYAAAIEAWEASDVLHAYAPTKRNLAQGYFDHMNKPEKAREMLESALTLAVGADGDSAPRILYELVQLYKNTRVSVDERIDLLETHPSLAAERDDCYLEYIILLTQKGEYERAIELLGSKRFNIYEGGEGKLTRHHGWIYTLMGHRAYRAGEYKKALEFCKNALVYPANYGEGRHYSAQEANIYYYMGLISQSLGDEAAAREAFVSGANQPPQNSEMTYFAGACLEALGDADKAGEVYAGMVKAGNEMLATADLRGYFGVGMASPAPFEQDSERLRRIDAYLLLALGEKGRHHDRASMEASEKLRALDPYNVKLCFFDKLGIL